MWEYNGLSTFNYSFITWNGSNETSTLSASKVLRWKTNYFFQPFLNFWQKSKESEKTGVKNAVRDFEDLAKGLSLEDGG